MYKSLLRYGLLDPIFRIAGRPVFKFLDQLEESQWFTAEKLYELQTLKLKNLVNYVYKNVPYYQKLMKEINIVPNDINSVEDLQCFPILTKEIINENREILKSNDFDRIPHVKGGTGGSTGDPLKFWMDKKSWALSSAARYRGLEMAGYQIGDKIITFGGSSLHPQINSKYFVRIFHWLERNRYLSGIQLSDEKLGQYTDEMLKYQPKFIYGYASSLYIWADYLKRNDIQPNFIKAIFPTAEILLPHYKSTIERGFGCDTYNSYGARDGNIYTSECKEHNGLHISVELSVVEVVDPQTNKKTEGMGEILLTDLNNYSFPFIRYRIGDVGVLSKQTCSCGRGLPLLKEIIGRSGDIMKFANGKVLTGPAFTVLFSKLGFSKYKIIQTGDMSVTVKVVKSEGDYKDDIRMVKESLLSHLGEEVDVRVEVCDDLEDTKSGKKGYFLSL